MATRLRVFVPVGTKEYAELWGVSQRTARRRIAALPGAVKVGTGWKVPVLATDYAKRKGISAKTARRRGVRAATPIDLRDLIANKYLSKLKGESVVHLSRLAASRPRFNPLGVVQRVDHATAAQLRKAKKLRAQEWEEALRNPTGEWEGDDGYSILYYH